jgi:hypothetical protein
MGSLLALFVILSSGSHRASYKRYYSTQRVSYRSHFSFENIFFFFFRHTTKIFPTDFWVKNFFLCNCVIEIVTHYLSYYCIYLFEVPCARFEVFFKNTVYHTGIPVFNDVFILSYIPRIPYIIPYYTCVYNAILSVFICFSFCATNNPPLYRILYLYAKCSEWKKILFYLTSFSSWRIELRY